MNVLEAIKKRKSYRDVFKKEPVPREDLREILEAGTAAPSAATCRQHSLSQWTSRSL